MELDLWDFYKIQYKNRYLPQGTPGKLSTRQLLLFVDDLPKRGSRFWAVLADIDFHTSTDWILLDLFHATSGEPHPMANLREAKRKDHRKKLRIEAAKKAEQIRQKMLKALERKG